MSNIINGNQIDIKKSLNIRTNRLAH